MSAEGAAAHAAYIESVKANGVVVEIEEEEFVKLIANSPHEALTLVYSEQGFFNPMFHYLVSVGGIAFHTKAYQKLDLDMTKIGVQVTANKISVPRL